ncbi:MAG: helix-turn-helix transcriptional regulator [Bacteroidales bacterium]|nr:helix-turn-helix transcriptional regulator [Bacteroidales bacterium]
MKDINKKIGEQLKARRLELNLSQRELADIIDLHPNNVYETENGKRGISVQTLEKYCKALKLRVELVENEQ